MVGSLRCVPPGRILALDGPGAVPSCQPPWWPCVTLMPPGSSGGKKKDPWPLGGEKHFFPKFLRLVVDMPADRPEAGKCHGPHGGAVGTCAATPTDTCTSHPMLWGSDTLRGHNPTGHRGRGHRHCHVPWVPC